MTAMGLFILHCSLFISGAAAQSGVEYWIDSDPGRGKATKVSATMDGEGNVLFDAPTTGLSVGSHLMGVRAYNTDGDNTFFGPTIIKDIFVPRTDGTENIAYVEYFWDVDPGLCKGTRIAITPGEEVSIENLELSTADLTEGFHQLGFRAYGCDGWGPTAYLTTYVPMHRQDALVDYAEYFWNDDPGYGQGTPVSITPAGEVTLDALGIATTEIHGDALFFIRYHGPYGWSPTLCYKVLVDAEGNYTLNAQAETSIDTRNYQTLADAFSDFADRGVGNDITLTLPTSNTDYALDATTADVLAQLEAISESIDRISTEHECKTIGFKATEGIGNTLTVTTTDEGLSTVVGLFARTWQENVALTINGTACDFSSFAQAPRYEELCAEVETTPVSIAAPADGMTVTFTAQPQQGTVLSGFATETTATLPAMTIASSGSTTEALPYHVALCDADGTELAAYTYNIYVRPRVGIQTFSGLSPAMTNAEGADPVPALLDPGLATLRWNAVPGAEGYRLTITDTTGDTPVTVPGGSAVEATTYPLTVESGHRYSWQVTAIGLCDELDSPVMTLEGRLLPDLAVSTVTLPATAAAGNTITLTATVVNQGEGATTEASWTDRLYYVIDSEDFAYAVQAGEQTHSGNLSAGASYDLTFQLKVPQVDNGSLRLFIVTDAKAQVMETDDDNNRTLSAAATLQPFYMNAADLSALRQLCTDFGGTGWNGTLWDTTSDVITPGNWSGVTFDTEGRVTAINLQGRGLAGSLSAATPYVATLSQLKSLNLSRNAITGDPALFLQGAGAQLTTVNLAYNQIDELSALLPATVTSLDLSYQHRQYGNNSVLTGFDQLTPEVLNIGSAMTVALPAPALYSHAAQAFSAHPQLYVYSSDMQTRYGTLNWSATYGTYAYDKYTNWLHSMEQDAGVVLTPADGTLMHHSAWPAQMHFTTGDANLTGLVDVNDVQRTLNYVINQNNTTTFGLWAANTFTGGEAATVINIQDIVCTVNIVLANEGTSAARRSPEFPEAPASPGFPASPASPVAPEAPNLFYTDGRKLLLQADDEVAAFCLELGGASASQVKLLLPARDWQMQTRNTDGGVRLVVFSPTGQTLPTGTTQLLRLGADGAWPVGATASSAEAEPLIVAVGADASMGIGDRERTMEDGAVYDLQGRKMDSDRQLRKGVYIQNGKKVKR